MRCCQRCEGVRDREFLIDGDGDGIEFLTEISYGDGGGRRETSVVLVH